MSSNEQRAFRRTPFTTRLISLVLFCCLALTAEWLYRELQRSQAELKSALLDSYARELSTLLEYELHASVQLTLGMASYIETKRGELKADDIEPWLAPLAKNGRHFRNVALAPGNIVTLVYPREGNENVIGLNYPRIPDQWPEIETIILSRKPMLAGPLPLVQGGTGLIYRIPIYIDRHYWGIVSTVINADSLFAVIEQRADELDVEFALIEGKANRRYWQLLLGEARLMDTAETQIKLNLPGRHWQLLAQYQTEVPFSQYWVRFLGWGFALTLSIGLYVYCRRSQPT